MAPLGEWSLEATFWLEPGACPAPSSLSTKRRAGIFLVLSARRRSPEHGGERTAH
jgi:hypothetical protein